MLNASHPSVAFGYTAVQIQDLVNVALASGDESQIIELAGMLDRANNAVNGCPLT